MQIKYYVTAEGHASEYGSNHVQEHHKHCKVANHLEQHGLLRFVEQTDVPPVNNDDGRIPSTTYYKINDWVTPMEVAAMKQAGVKPKVEQVEVFNNNWTVALSHPLVKLAFVAWNIMLMFVLYTVTTIWS